VSKTKKMKKNEKKLKKCLQKSFWGL